MSSQSDFLTAWKARFPTTKPPKLDCFQPETSTLDKGLNFDLVREEKRKYEESIHSLKNQLYQKEFVAGYLWELLHNGTKTDNISKVKDTGSVNDPNLTDFANNDSSIDDNDCMMRSDPDLDLDCQVPVVDEGHLSGDRIVCEQVPAYLETDLDFDMKSSHDSLISDPGYLPPSSLKLRKGHLRPTINDDSTECKSLDSGIDALVKNELPSDCMVKQGVHVSDEENEPGHLWTKRANFGKAKTDGEKNEQNFSGKDVKPTDDSETDTNKFVRMLSAESNKPSSFASQRQDLFHNQRKSCSVDLYCPPKHQVQSSSPPQGGSLRTFKPHAVNTTHTNSAGPEIDRKSKPVPTPRISIGTPEFKVGKLHSDMCTPKCNESSPVGERKNKITDISKVKIPPGMCRIAPPTNEGHKSSTLPVNISSRSISESSSVNEKIKREKPERPKKPSIKKQDYMNFEIGSIKAQQPPATSHAAGPPIMVVKTINTANKSPQLSRGISEATPEPTRVAPLPPSVPRPATSTLDDVIPKPTDDQTTSPKGEVIYEEPIPVEREKLEEASSSDEDEPVYQNLMLLKHQSLSRGRSQSGAGMFTSMDFQKRHLQKKAERLSRRFSSLDVGSTLSRYVGTDQLKSIGEQDHTDARRGGVDPVMQGDSGSDSWRKRQSMLFATGDDNTSEDDLDVMVPTYAEADKIHMRKYVVTSIVASERMYLLTLDTLMQYMQTFKNVQNTPQSVITSEDIDIIFCKIAELHRIHFNFIKSLEPKLENWTGEEEIAEHFKILALEECPLATEYLKNYQNAVSTIHRCTTESPQFAELTQSIKSKGSTETSTLEELLHKPVVRFQRNTLVLHDLIKFTPTSHSDYDTLQKTKKIAQNFLENFESPVDKANAENQRYLSKQGLVVEKVGSGIQRKLRQIFLFDDVLVCAKQKLSRQKITHELKWAIPLIDLAFIDDRLIAQEERLLIENSKQETDKLQRRVGELQNELKQEMKKAKLASDGQRSWSFRGHKGNLEKMKKKLYEQECQLMLAAPHLILKIKHQRMEKCYMLLLTSDYERIGWKETVMGLQSKNIIPRPLPLVDLANLVNSLKLPRLTATGSMDINDFELETEALFGSLDVTVHKLYGLKVPSDVYCCMEVDTFGHFCMKAKTNMIAGSTEPSWNENFDIELDGAQQLRVLVYKMTGDTDTLVGKCALELCKGWLRGDFSEETISIGDSMTLVLSLMYRNREQTIKRTPSSVQGGLFGVRITTVAKREGAKVPMIVSACIQEVERRGLYDVGIYRISGLNAEIQKLKRAFERCKNPHTANMLVKELDINVVTGVLKLYFRELPESLFTDKLYYRFQEGMTLSDPEAKEKCMMTIFKSLPEPHLSTAMHVLDHLYRVAQHEAKNKMSVQNLSTVFGPTLLRPATKESEPLSMEQLFTAGARDAMMQTAILYFYLSNWHNKDTLLHHNTRL